MTFSEAVATQPQWVQIWVNILTIGAFIPPFLMLIWKPSRIAGLATIVANIISALSVMWMYGQMGYVKLLGLPHVLIWTPALLFLIWTLRHKDVPTIPKWLIHITAATIFISLLFDYTDVARYILGERAPS